MVKMKPVCTLGICNDEISSACLFKDGELVSAASEERFSRKKLDSSFPQ
jgi:predicted NodU family carbamoyl transferase